MKRWLTMGILGTSLAFAPVLVVSAHAGTYTRPKSSARATEIVAPAALQSLPLVSSYTQPPATTVAIGAFKNLSTQSTAAAEGTFLALQWTESLNGVTVYRVEGLPNTFLDIDTNGIVRVREVLNGQGERRVLYLNFGDRLRAYEFFKTRLAQEMPEVRLKAFKVPGSFVDWVDSIAKIEDDKRLYPNNPQRVDVKYERQFGLRADQISRLEKEIIQGTGRDLTPALPGTVGKGGIVNGALVETDAMLARRLAPFIEKMSKVSGKMFQPIERLGQTLAAAFPAAAAKGAAALTWIAPYAAGLGKILGVIGIVFGLFQMRVGAKRIYELIMEHGLGVLGTKEGAVVLLETLAAGLETLSAAAAVAALFSSATVIGGIGFGALSLILLAGGLALRGTALLVENWDNVVAFAQQTWEGMKNAAARGYAWVKDSASAAMAWAKEQVGKLAAGTKVALQRAGQWLGEVVRGTVQVVEQVTVKVVENVQKVVTWVEERATTVWKKGIRMVEKIVAVAKDVLEPVVRTGKRMVTAMVDVARQIPRTIYDTATRIVDRVVPVVRQVTDWVTERATETYRYATTVMRNVAEWTTERVREAYTVVREVPRQVTEWVTERVREAYQVARQVSRQVTEWVTERVQEAYTATRQVARTVWDTVTEWVPKQVRSWLGRLWGWVTQWVSQVKQVARTVWDTVYDTAYRWVDKAKQVTKTVYDTVYDTAYRWVDRAKQVTKTVYDTVRDTMYRWGEKPVQVIRQVADTVWQTGQRIVERVVPIVRNITDYVTQKVEETYQVARTVYDTVVEKVPQLVEEAYTYVEQVPKRIVEQVKQIVAEEYEYPETVIEKIQHSRTDVVPVEREVIQNVTKQVEGWVTK